jgi:hypothetical protein
VHGKLTLSGHTIQAAIRATVSNSVVLSANTDDNSNCEAGIISFLTVRQQVVTQLKNYIKGGVCQGDVIDWNNHHCVLRIQMRW